MDTPFQAYPASLEANIPTGGQLCFRRLPEGEALVGILAFGNDFTPEEDRTYLLVEHALGFGVVPLDGETATLGGDEGYLGVGDMMQAPIWPKTTDPAARTVRFLQAFPEQNRWTVFGVSCHAAKDGPDHRWVKVSHQGQAQEIEPPFNANGSAMGQLLTMHAVWPDDTGVPHTLPQMPARYREHYHRYHQLLAASTRDEALDACLEKTIAQDPQLRHMWIGRMDRDYCRYLAALEDRGLLTVDAPQTASGYAQRSQVSAEILRETMDGASLRRGPRM